ncbi:MAG TPA: hypothetical protein VHG28_03945 [Longimicrobiaceae bacterium]|nr:hypothetical protein [Longimicrobiaceae bacterium]
MYAMEPELTRQWVLDGVWEDYRLHLGRVLRVQFLLAYNTRYLDLERIELAFPAWVRVVETPRHEVERVAPNGSVEPLWAVELVERHPELADARNLVLWILGHAYSLQTGEPTFAFKYRVEG